MRLRLSKAQWEFVQGLGIEDREYTEAEIDDFVIETVADCLQRRGFTRGQEDVNDVGAICEAILDAIQESR